MVGLLGKERVRSVTTKALINADGQKIARITVVYGAGYELSVSEMDSILDKLWPDDGASANEPIPIIDFQEESEIDHIAAE